MAESWLDHRTVEKTTQPLALQRGTKGQRWTDFLEAPRRMELSFVTPTLAQRLLCARGDGVRPKRSLNHRDVTLSRHYNIYERAHSTQGQEVGPWAHREPCVLEDAVPSSLGGPRAPCYRVRPEPGALCSCGFPRGHTGQGRWRVKSLAGRLRLSRLQLYPAPAGCPWGGYLTSLCLRFLIIQWG